MILLKTKHPHLLITIGMFSLALGILLNRFGGDQAVTHFFGGLLIGLSLVTNGAYLVLWRRSRRDGE